ncbi:Dynein assembly factor 1, axonemal [Thoreauomyces humboldtii]|nr:Dynein assembly factor 1, axonemal [Thoreauomyces humboldtii]
MSGYRPWSSRREAKEVDEHGSTLMTPRYLLQLCREQKLYQTPELNDKMYLHFKGFAKIENLAPYTGLKSLWLEGNGISEMSGLEAAKELRCLFMSQNCIEKIEGLDGLDLLDTLNLDNNLIKSVGGLGVVGQLKTLQLANNFLTKREDVEGLRECPSISILDLSGNKLEDPEIMDVLFDMPNLAVLNLMSNPVISKIKNYRRVLISRIKTLTYLDDRPVFDKERLAVEAWARGGADAERDERERQRNADRDEQNRNFEALRKLQEDARGRRRATYGEEPTPVYNPGLTHLRETMLKKIEDDSNDAPPSSDLAPAADAAPSDAHAPIRRFTELSTTGKKLVVGGDSDDDEEGDEADDEDEKKDDHEVADFSGPSGIPPLETVLRDDEPVQEVAPAVPATVSFGTPGWASRSDRRAATVSSGIQEIVEDETPVPDVTEIRIQDTEQEQGTFEATENDKLRIRPPRKEKPEEPVRDSSADLLEEIAAESQDSQDRTPDVAGPLVHGDILEEIARDDQEFRSTSNDDTETPQSLADRYRNFLDEIVDSEHQDHPTLSETRAPETSQQSYPDMASSLRDLQDLLSHSSSTMAPGHQAERLVHSMYGNTSANDDHSDHAIDRSIRSDATASAERELLDVPAASIENTLLPDGQLRTSVPVKSAILASRRLIEEIEAKEVGGNVKVEGKALEKGRTIEIEDDEEDGESHAEIQAKNAWH